MRASRSPRPSLTQLVVYFLKLGATGFGGPVALANYMRADLFERRKWFTEDEYEQGLAIATALPGPMAYKLAIYCGYIAHGVVGGVTVGFAFAIAPFVLVVLAAFVYTRYAASDIVRGLFYGVGPVVVALILNASLDLGVKTLKREVPAWIVALVALAATIALQRELTIIFVLAGVLGIFLFAPQPKPPPARPAAVGPSQKVSANALPLLAAAVPAAVNGMAWQLFAFFFKTGLLVFGSGLVIVSFVKAYVVDQYHWLDNRTFLDAVAIGMISPGPVVITATFVGYIVGGLLGAVAATFGIFLPSIVLTIVGTPILMRYRSNRSVMGFVRGVTVAVVGVLAGTTYLVGRPVIGDLLTVVLLVAAIVATRRAKKIPDQALIVGGAIVGLIAYPLLRPTWIQ
ncbi:MAG: chromate efflux transporter [Candidatus Tumulicola sp.]